MRLKKGVNKISIIIALLVLFLVPFSLLIIKNDILPVFYTDLVRLDNKCNYLPGQLELRFKDFVSISEARKFGENVLIKNYWNNLSEYSYIFPQDKVADDTTIEYYLPSLSLFPRRNEDTNEGEKSGIYDHHDLIPIYDQMKNDPDIEQFDQKITYPNYSDSTAEPVFIGRLMFIKLKNGIDFHRWLAAYPKLF